MFLKMFKKVEFNEYFMDQFGIHCCIELEYNDWTNQMFGGDIQKIIVQILDSTIPG